MWWTGSAVGLDFETDHREPTEARMVTAAIVQVGPGGPPVELEIMAKPERPIPNEATNLHGITTERAEAEGIEREAAVRAVVEQLALAGPDRPVVCHNAPYDLTVLDREMRRTGIGYLAVDRSAFGFALLVVDGVTAADFPVVDTLVLDKAVDRYRPGKRKLEAAAAYYGVPMAEGSAHGATADVIAALRIAITIANRSAMANGSRNQYEQILQMYGDRRSPEDIAVALTRCARMTLPELHAAQVRWAAEQAEGLREYFLKKGDKESAASVSGEWPFRMLREDETTETVSTTVL